MITATLCELAALLHLTVQHTVDAVYIDHNWCIVLFVYANAAVPNDVERVVVFINRYISPANSVLHDCVIRFVPGV